MDTGAVQLGLGVTLALVLVALAFDFMNGFHDAANSIATVVSTRVLSPYQAVLLAAFFNFAALVIFHLSVATTVGKGIIDQGVVDHHLVFGALVGAISWNTNRAKKLKNAASSTAWCGLSTRVDTTVAIEFAASWKPFMKSNASATSTSAMTTQSASCPAAPPSIRSFPARCLRRCSPRPRSGR